ncbi:MAG: SDR family oxidoreductase [Pelolinea sp.]|nr:SDR family oxidoreductase [Pelolinea sp.]
MNDQTILVTGGTDGIGKETAIQLARMGACVLVHGRDQKKGTQVIKEINRDTGNEKIALYLADFSSLADIKRMAEDIKREQKTLHVLVNNAGNFYKERRLSAEGFEMTFAVNYLAPFLLTMLLLDLIKASAPARIVNVSSSSHRSIKNIDPDNLQSDHDYDGYTAYSLSKLENVLFTQSLIDKLKGTGVTVNALHPGVVNTNLLRKSYAMEGVGVEEGAKTSTYLASSPDVAQVSGKYFDNMRERPASDLSQNRELQDAIWDLSIEMVSEFLN